MLTNNRSDSCERYVVRADEKLRAFLELEVALRSGRARSGLRSGKIKFDKLSRIK